MSIFDVAFIHYINHQSTYESHVDSPHITSVPSAYLHPGYFQECFAKPCWHA